MDTNITLSLNETYVYNLPEIIDREGNADSHASIEPYAGYEALFPPFMHVANANLSLEFKIDKPEYQG